MKQLFKSKHPIVCSPMNGVSDLTLALACADAGIVPSLIPYPDFKLFLENIKAYEHTGKELIVAMSLEHVVHYKLYEKILNSKITHIELLDFELSEMTSENINKINSLRKNGIQIILKILTRSDIVPYRDIIDAVTVKGNEGAGRSLEGIDLITEIKTIKLDYPDIKIIASGGIKNKSDIDKLLQAGASAVGIGTMFAMSQESSIPRSVKDKLLLSTIADISRLTSGAQQRAVIFGKADLPNTDDFNNTQSLNQGLKTGTHGHVFIGNAIDSITDILTVKEIVDYLTA